MKYNFLLFVFGIIISSCNVEKSKPTSSIKLLPTDGKTSILGSWRLSDVIEIGTVKNEDPLLTA